MFLSKFSLQYSSTNNDVREKNSLTLDNVTTIQCTMSFIEREREWIIFALPNLRHVIVSGLRVRLGKCKSISILIKSIRQLDIIIRFELGCGCARRSIDAHAHTLCNEMRGESTNLHLKLILTILFENLREFHTIHFRGKFLFR